MTILERLQRFWRKHTTVDWRHVPPPNWASKRGWMRDTW